MFFRWNKERKEWVPRMSGYPLGRLMHVNPSPRNMELFFLRLLLLNRPGMQSFQDLLTVNGVTCGTFKEAAKLMGIDEHPEVDYRAALDEVCAHASPYQTRVFFATLLAVCSVDEVEDLWAAYRAKFSEDFVRKGHSEMDAMLRARSHILKHYQRMTDQVRVAGGPTEDDSFALAEEPAEYQFAIPGVAEDELNQTLETVLSFHAPSNPNCDTGMRLGLEFVNV